MILNLFSDIPTTDEKNVCLFLFIYYMFNMSTDIYNNFSFTNDAMNFVLNFYIIYYTYTLTHIHSYKYTHAYLYRSCNKL